jgi:hypothetical protein
VTADFATQWLKLTTTSASSNPNCSIASGKSGRYWR